MTFSSDLIRIAISYGKIGNDSDQCCEYGVIEKLEYSYVLHRRFELSCGAEKNKKEQRWKNGDYLYRRVDQGRSVTRTMS